ncbi:MAG: hypothetical protein HWE22_12765 [Flavobacteriales bacterium]|nr:hypothetical protein [Flavobacteriales bacterium]
MQKTLLLFAVSLLTSPATLAQSDLDKKANKFQYYWSEHQLPESSYMPYHGTTESYFIDSINNRIPNHSYKDIKTGGKHHFIVQSDKGFHLLDTKLKLVTDKAYDLIELNHGSELELTSEGKKSYYVWDSDTKTYAYTNEVAPPTPWAVPPKRTYDMELGKVSDNRFKSKRIERLRLGIDMTKTLTTEQKGKKLLVMKNGEIVFKGAEKPMLYYDFMITGEKGPHAIYHPSSKKPILENCDRFWCVESYLIVSVKDNLRKYIISDKGEIVLTTAGEIRYYDYDFGGEHYSYFCDGRTVLNLSGNVVYHSDGELIGVGEHYIFAGNKGGYLGDLSHDIKMECTNFKRIGNLTIGQLGKDSWRLFDPTSVLIKKFSDFYYNPSDSLVVCSGENKTIVANPVSGKIHNIDDFNVRAQKQSRSDDWKYYVLAKGKEDGTLEGRFDPKEGKLIEPDYLKIEWPTSEDYYIVLTEEGTIRYLKHDGSKLFD